MDIVGLEPLAHLGCVRFETGLVSVLLCFAMVSNRVLIVMKATKKC